MKFGSVVCMFTLIIPVSSRFNCLGFSVSRRELSYSTEINAACPMYNWLILVDFDGCGSEVFRSVLSIVLVTVILFVR